MYSSTLYFHFKATKNNRHVLKMFFEDWADTICNNNVKISIVDSDFITLTMLHELIRVDFVNEEDATVMKLKGVPEEFQKYLKLVDYQPIDTQAYSV